MGEIAQTCSSRWALAWGLSGPQPLGRGHLAPWMSCALMRSSLWRTGTSSNSAAPTARLSTCPHVLLLSHQHQH